MSFIYTLLWVIFVVDSLLLVLIVMLQSGRGGGLSGMLGGGGMAESALGPRTGLPRITGVMAGIFFVTAILIGILTRPPQALDKEPGKKADATEEAGKSEAAPATSDAAGSPKAGTATAPSTGTPAAAPTSATPSGATP